MANHFNSAGNKRFDSGTTRCWPDATTMSPQFGTSSAQQVMSVPPAAASSGKSLATPQFRLSPAPSQVGTSIPVQTDVDFQEGPPLSTDKGYIPFYLQSNIGKNVRAEFIIGSDQFIDKTGKLIEVGINYFVLEDYVSHARIMCDLYSVKFVTTL